VIDAGMLTTGLSVRSVTFAPIAGAGSVRAIVPTAFVPAATDEGAMVKDARVATGWTAPRPIFRTKASSWCRVPPAFAGWNTPAVVRKLSELVEPTT
jgi:hypothetical protein